jgi:hypothetical protein
MLEDSKPTSTNELRAPAAPEPEKPAPKAPDAKEIQRGSIRFNVVAQIALGLVLFGMVNYLGLRHFWIKDNTIDKQFSLSDSSQTFLSRLDRKIAITVLTQKGSKEGRDIWQLAELYKNKSKDKVRIQLVDVVKDLDLFQKVRDEAAKQGVRIDSTGVFVRLANTGEKNRKADNTENPQKNLAEEKQGGALFVPQDSLFRYQAGPDRGRQITTQFLGETAITGAMMAVSRGDRPKAYIVMDKGKPRVTPLGSMWTLFSDMLRQQNVDVEPLELANEGDIPADANAVALLGPSVDINDRELEMLRRFWNSKRKGLMIMLNSAELNHPKPILEKFLAENGILAQPDRILRTHGTDLGVDKEYQVEAFFEGGNSITEPMKETTTSLPGCTRSLKINRQAEKPRTENIEIRELLRAGTGYWGEMAYFDRAPEFSEGDNKGPLYAAVSLERGASRDPLVQVESSRLVVLGNSHLLEPDTVAQSNYDFVNASMQWMLQRDQHIGINPRPKSLFKVTLNESQLNRVFILTVVVLPTIVFLVGLAVWGGRRQ